MTIWSRLHFSSHVTGLSRWTRPFFLPNTTQHVRHFRWRPRNTLVEDQEPSEAEIEGAKAAILDKVMKGRQPNDLMLRCKSDDAHFHTRFNYLKALFLMLKVNFHLRNTHDLRLKRSQVMSRPSLVCSRKRNSALNTV